MYGSLRPPIRDSASRRGHFTAPYLYLLREDTTHGFRQRIIRGSKWTQNVFSQQVSGPVGGWPKRHRKFRYPCFCHSGRRWRTSRNVPHTGGPTSSHEKVLCVLWPPELFWRSYLARQRGECPQTRLGLERSTKRNATIFAGGACRSEPRWAMRKSARNRRV